MSADKTILSELGAISPVVAGIGSAVPYSVPVGYFEAFAGTLMAHIKETAGQAVENGSVPPDAETSSASGDKVGPETIQGVLAGLQDRSAYEVPVGFFDGFAEKLMQRIKAGEAASPSEELEILSPLLSRLAKKEPFAAPEGYFSELSGNLVAELQALRFVNDELEKNGEPGKNDESGIDQPEILSPLLLELKNKRTYTVTPEYFDTLASNILSHVSRDGADAKEEADVDVKAGAKVVSLTRGRTRSWMKYAVAAAVAGLLVTTGIRIFHNNGQEIARVIPVTDSLGGANLAKVSDQDILNYLENDDEPLANVASNNATAMLDINDNDVKDFLGDVPDAELQQYVDDQGSSKDPLTN